MQIQKTFSDSPVWSFTRHYPGMLRACFNVAQLIVYLSFTESTSSRCCNVGICTHSTGHILINCSMVQTCRESFDQSVVRHFNYNVCNVLPFIERSNIAALFGLKDCDIFHTKDILFVHSVLKCYIY